MKARLFILCAACLWGVALSFQDDLKVHDKLSDTEFQKIFHRSRRNVPSYEFVKFETKTSHRAKREVRPVEFNVDGKNVRLNLHPVEHNVFYNDIPVWYVETDDQGHSYTYHKANSTETKIEGVFYEDPKSMATLLAYYKDNYIYYDGIFGESKESKIIRSEPEKWWQNPEDVENQNHFIYGVNETGSTIVLPNPNYRANYEKLDEPLETFYPKLLLIVDYSHFEKLGKDVQETIKYVATLWNAVNLKYSKVESPKIKIVITGLIIAKDPTALEYVYKAQNPSDLTKLNYLEMLNNGKIYFRDEFYKDTEFGNYDTTMTMTSLDTGANAGAAWQGEICGNDLNIGYVKDDGSFSGLLGATHELGHLLNLPHDAREINGCDGYIDDDTSTVMAPFVSYVKHFIWSECSKRTLAEFAWNKKAECLKDYDHYPPRK